MLWNADEAALTAYLEKTYSKDLPPAHASSEEYSIVRSRSLRHHYIGITAGFNLLTLNVSLGDWGVADYEDRDHSHLIQPRLLRAPEVMLEASWGPPVDLWNLGALLRELLFGQNMFSGEDNGECTVKGHLAEMNALLGPFPKSLRSEAKLKGAVEMFDEHGNVRKYRLKTAVALPARLADLPDNEAPKFEAFVRRLLTIDPRTRKSAEAMLEDPWLSHEYTQSLSMDKVS